MELTLGTTITKKLVADTLPVGTSCVYKDDMFGIMVAATKHERGWYSASDWESTVSVISLLPMTIVYYPGA